MKEYQKYLKERPRTPTPPPRESSPILPSSPPSFATPPPPHTPQTNWMEYSTPLTLRTRQKGVDYISERIKAAIDGILVTLLVIRVQDKVEQASQRSILARALATNRVLDLSIVEKARQARKDSRGNKIVQKFGEIYGREARKQIEEDDTDKLKVVNMR